MTAQHNFGYRIRNDGVYWTWAVLDGSGTIKREGRAATKAVAAACVIRELAPRVELAERRGDAA